MPNIAAQQEGDEAAAAKSKKLSMIRMKKMPKSKLKLDAVGPSPTLHNFESFAPPDMGGSLASLGEADGQAASLLSSYYSESFQRSTRKGFDTSSALPEKSKRIIGRVPTFTKSKQPQYTCSLNSYSSPMLFVTPVWQGTPSRTMSRSGARNRSTGKNTRGRPSTAPGGVSAQSSTSDFGAGNLDAESNVILRTPQAGEENSLAFLSQSSIASFSQKSSAISNLGQKKLFASTVGRNPVPKSTLQYTMISEPPLKKKGPTYANSPILRRLASPYGDFTENLAAASTTTTPKKKTAKKKTARKKTKKKKQVEDGLPPRDIDYEERKQLEQQEEARRKQEVEEILKLERLQSHEVRQREAASLLRQQAVWASIGSLVSKDFLSPTKREEVKKEAETVPVDVSEGLQEKSEETPKPTTKQNVEALAATTVRLEIGDDGRVKIGANDSSEQNEESIKEKVTRMRAELRNSNNNNNNKNNNTAAKL
ncbi:hypothetical protein TrST_g9625 [Triparma strigata]|uniref:Uncharacterized protein n=1 Tax=Triparma strigata TaxID=1606541 RepID=A0A9W7E0E6_9STRA|nr:hypothetical protein TrST_g9625 [Triparma strigata]